MTLSPEALILVQDGLRSLKEGGDEGHGGDCYWNADGSRRCVWGHIIKAAYPDHDLGDRELVYAVRLISDVGREIDLAYEAMYDRTIDWASSQGYAEAVANLDQFLVAHTPAPKTDDVIFGLA